MEHIHRMFDKMSYTQFLMWTTYSTIYFFFFWINKEKTETIVAFFFGNNRKKKDFIIYNFEKYAILARLSVR